MLKNSEKNNPSKRRLASKKASWPLRMNAMTRSETTPKLMAGSKEFEEAFSFIVQ
jgi:hypothetical protein